MTTARRSISLRRVVFDALDKVAHDRELAVTRLLDNVITAWLAAETGEVLPKTRPMSPPRRVSAEEVRQRLDTLGVVEASPAPTRVERREEFPSQHVEF